MGPVTGALSQGASPPKYATVMYHIPTFQYLYYGTIVYNIDILTGLRLEKSTVFLIYTVGYFMHLNYYNKITYTIKMLNEAK